MTPGPVAVRRPWMAGYLALMAAAVGVVAAIGVFGRGDGTTEAVVSARGEPFDMVTTGVYAWNPERLVAEGVGWDVFTLAIAVPALLFAAWGVWRGSLRWRLVAVGLLVYLWYQYLMYAMAWAIGPLFLPFVAIVAAAAIGVAWVASSVPVTSLAHNVTEGYPRRGMMIFCAAMALLLLGMWLPMIATVLRGDLEGTLLGQTTLVVQALDLGVIVPLSLATLVLLWRRAPAAVLVATALAVKGLAMAVAICAMLVSAWAVEGALEIGPFVLFAAIALACLTLLVLMLRAIREEPVHEPASLPANRPASEERPVTLTG